MVNGVRHLCAHASGQFKDSEKNYHVIYKEILAVKYGSFGRFLRTISSKVTAFLADETTVVLFLSILGSISINCSEKFQVFFPTIRGNDRRINHTGKNPHYTITDPDPPATSPPKEMTNAGEEAYLQAEAYLDQRHV